MNSDSAQRGSEVSLTQFWRIASFLPQRTGVGFPYSPGRRRAPPRAAPPKLSIASVGISYTGAPGFGGFGFRHSFLADRVAESAAAISKLFR
jgi:hypothetical protein